jgi:hypothetical protein
MGAGSSVDVSDFQDDRLIKLLEQVKGKKVGNLDLSEENVNDIMKIIEQSQSKEKINEEASDRTSNKASSPLVKSPTSPTTISLDIMRSRLRSAIPMDIDAMDVAEVVAILTSDELSSGNGDDVTSQVNVGGRVYFVIVKDSNGTEKVFVVKFCKNSLETISEAFANQIATKLGVNIAPIKLVRKPEATWLTLVSKIESMEQGPSLVALTEDLELFSCFLLQGFVHAVSFSFEAFLRNSQVSNKHAVYECGVTLGRIYITDIVLRNCDRLIDVDLQWRGNLTNLMLATSPMQLIGEVVYDCTCFKTKHTHKTLTRLSFSYVVCVRVRNRHLCVSSTSTSSVSERPDSYSTFIGEGAQPR